MSSNSVNHNPYSFRLEIDFSAVSDEMAIDMMKAIQNAINTGIKEVNYAYVIGGSLRRDNSDFKTVDTCIDTYMQKTLEAFVSSRYEDIEPDEVEETYMYKFNDDLKEHAIGIAKAIVEDLFADGYKESAIYKKDGVSAVLEWCPVVGVYTADVECDKEFGHFKTGYTADAIADALVDITVDPARKAFGYEE